MEAASVHKGVRTCRARSGLAACGSSSRSSSLSLAYAPNASISAQHLRADRVWRSVPTQNHLAHTLSAAETC